MYRHIVIMCICGKVDIACDWYQYYQRAAKITMSVGSTPASKGLLQIFKQWTC